MVELPRCPAAAKADFLLLYRVPLQGNVGLDGEESMASVASHRSGLSSSRAPALLQTAVRYRAGAGSGAGALCSTPPSANKKGGWSMSSTGRGSPGPTPKPRVGVHVAWLL